MNPKNWFGKTVVQIACGSPENEHMLGRKGTVTDVSTDEQGNTRILTDDGIWCPETFLMLSPGRFIHPDVGAVVTRDGKVGLFAEEEATLDVVGATRLRDWLNEYIKNHT